MTHAPGRQAIHDVAALINRIDICVLASRAEDGELHARPMSNNGEADWDGQSWFLAPSDGRLVAELRANPEAVTTYRAETGYTFVTISGRTTLETDPSLKRRLWLDELERWFPNGPEDPNVTLIRLDAEAAQWWTEDGDGSADLREVAATS